MVFLKLYIEYFNLKSRTRLLYDGIERSENHFSNDLTNSSFNRFRESVIKSFILMTHFKASGKTENHLSM